MFHFFSLLRVSVSLWFNSFKPFTVAITFSSELNIAPHDWRNFR